MNEQTNQEMAAEILRARIKGVFPDSVFSGAVTVMDDELPNDERDEEGNPLYDEEQALFDTLRNKRWPEVSTSFIEIYPDGYLLLSDEAVAAYLPAWLICALTHEEVRDMVVFTFSPDTQKSMEWSDHQLQRLTLPQIEAIREFLAHIVHFESSDFVKKHALSALTYVASFESMCSD